MKQCLTMFSGSGKMPVSGKRVLIMISEIGIKTMVNSPVTDEYVEVTSKDNGIERIYQVVKLANGNVKVVFTQDERRFYAPLELVEFEIPVQHLALFASMVNEAAKKFSGIESVK